MTQQKDTPEWHQKKTRLIKLVLAGRKKQIEVAAELGVTRQAVSNWIRSARESGGKVVSRGRGRPKLEPLTGSRARHIQDLLRREYAEAEKHNLPEWSLDDARRLIDQEYGMKFTRRMVYEMLDSWGLATRRMRPIGHPDYQGPVVSDEEDDQPRKRLAKSLPQPKEGPLFGDEEDTDGESGESGFDETEDDFISEQRFLREYAAPALAKRGIIQPPPSISSLSTDSLFSSPPASGKYSKGRKSPIQSKKKRKKRRK